MADEEDEGEAKEIRAVTNKVSGDAAPSSLPIHDLSTPGDHRVLLHREIAFETAALVSHRVA